MTRRLLAPVVFLTLAACGPLHTTVRPDTSSLATVKRVAVIVAEDGVFTVINERAKATATGAALFGIIGAVVSSAANQSMDSGEADKARPGIAGFSPARVLRDSFVDTLRSSGRVLVDTVDSEAGLQTARDHDAVIRLTIKEWGVRLPARAISDRLAAFAEIQARMTAGRGQNVMWDEHEVALGSGRYELAEFQRDAAVLRDQLTETFHGAGYRLANHLIYPREKRP